MVLFLCAQQLLAQSFLGGQGQDLARYYLLNAKRSVVCSERAVKGYGPCRFNQNDNDHLVYPEGSFFKVIHNSPLKDFGPDPNLGPNQRRFPAVDSIVTSFMPLTLVGLQKIDSDSALSEIVANPTTLKLSTVSPFSKALVGKGSDKIENLVNDGLSKPLKYPPFFGKLWFSCSMVQVSEEDFLNAVAQVCDCKLIVSPDAYSFVPEAEKIRARYLNAHRMFGDTTETVDGIKQRVRFRVFELAPSEIIVESVSNPKMGRTVEMYQDKELKDSIVKLIKIAVSTFSTNENPTVKELATNVNPEGEVKIGFSYGFEFYVAIPLKNGNYWLI